MGKCSKDKCYPDGRCREGEAQKKDCEHWNSDDKTDAVNNAVLAEENAYLLPWSGNSMGLDDIGIVSERSNPIQFGSIGEANSGKTTFLGLLYLLLSSGEQIGDRKFANSFSLLGWEYIANYMRYSGGNKPSFPPHTSSFSGRDVGLLHLGLRSKNTFTDYLYTDVPGEWFTNWAIDSNATDSGNASWINDNSAGFLLFIDCEGLVSQPGKYRQSTKRLIGRLLNNLDGKPVAILWSKADKFDEIKPAIKNIIQKEIKKIPNHKEFQISIHPGKGKTYHKNILKSINWLNENTTSSRVVDKIEFSSATNDDFFISYRGQL